MPNDTVKSILWKEEIILMRRMWIQLFMLSWKRGVFRRLGVDGDVWEFIGEWNVLFKDTISECKRPPVTEKYEGQQLKAMGIFFISHNRKFGNRQLLILGLQFQRKSWNFCDFLSASSWSQNGCCSSSYHSFIQGIQKKMKQRKNKEDGGRKGRMSSTNVK